MPPFDSIYIQRDKNSRMQNQLDLQTVLQSNNPSAKNDS